MDVQSSTAATEHEPERQDAWRAALWGGLLFGYFLLATQEKVTRSRKRAKALWRRNAATHAKHAAIDLRD
jgi:hypothetical protein